MGQFGFFDANRRLAAISAKGDPLEMIARVVPFESFRAEIEAAVLTPVSEKKSSAGRKPIDVMVMFRMLVLQSLYNLSDEQVEYQVRDRLSFTRFLRLGIEDSIPDGTTLWLFREALTKAGLIEKLFARFGQHLEAKGYIARGGQMVDATIVPVPKQRNGRDENEDVKAGKTPEAWQKNPAKNRQKDKDARWTKKHGKSFYGYKNHVNADAKHKLIRQYDVTDASVHDSQTFDGLVNQANTSADVYADSAYRSAEAEAKLSLRGLRSRIHLRASRNHPLSKAQTNANRQKSKVRARIEHVFGAQQNSPGGRIVRTIGIARAKAKIGLQNPCVQHPPACDAGADGRRIRGSVPGASQAGAGRTKKAYSRQIMSRNHRHPAPGINSTKNSSLFEVPLNVRGLPPTGAFILVPRVDRAAVDVPDSHVMRIAARDRMLVIGATLYARGDPVYQVLKLEALAGITAPVLRRLGVAKFDN